MTQSSDAILAFGLTMDGDDEKPEFLQGSYDIGEFLLKKAGLEDDYQVARKLEEECPAELVSHCSDSYTMYILAVRGTVTTASRGYPEDVSQSLVPVEPCKIAAFMEFCKQVGVEPKQPHWILASWLG